MQPGMVGTIFFVIGCVILWFSRHAIARSIRDAAGRSRANRAETQSQTQWGAANKENAKEREAQLAALNDAVPSMPPERMRATIHFNTFTIPRTDQRFFEASLATVQYGHTTRHAVDLFSEFSETERALIMQHNLHTVVVDEQPRFSKDELAEMRYRHTQEVNSIGGDSLDDMVLRQVTQQSMQGAQQLAKEGRVQTLLGDFLVTPFTKTFSHPHEAKQYGDKLREQILPGIKKIIDGYKDHTAGQTIEF